MCCVHQYNCYSAFQPLSSVSLSWLREAKDTHNTWELLLYCKPLSQLSAFLQTSHSWTGRGALQVQKRKHWKVVNNSDNLMVLIFYRSCQLSRNAGYSSSVTRLHKRGCWCKHILCTLSNFCSYISVDMTTSTFARKSWAWSIKVFLLCFRRGNYINCWTHQYSICLGSTYPRGLGLDLDQFLASNYKVVHVVCYRILGLTIHNIILSSIQSLALSVP